MQVLPNAFNLVITFLVPIVVWGLLMVGVYHLVREGRMHQKS
jgi:high-affinity Fe2+/Pb2+ permease